MKKSGLLSTLFILLTSLSFAQIPNFSFETWSNMGNYQNPDQWGTMNNTTAASGIYTATKATPGSPGSAYLKLTSKTINGDVVNGIAVSGVLDSIGWAPISGFAFTQRPASFTGKWQHMIFGTSQGSVNVKLTRWDAMTNQRVTVAVANQTLSGMAMSWANFSINFVYQDGNYPDSCVIFLKASGSIPTDQDYLWVDNLGFAGTVTALNTNDVVVKSIAVFPNPSSSALNVSFEMNKAQQTTITLTDIDGKLLITKDAGIVNGISTQTIDVNGFAAGAYFVNIITATGTETRKVILK